jgi:hypothetical protein
LQVPPLHDPAEVSQQSPSAWQVSPLSEQRQKPLSQMSVEQSLSWVQASLTWA